MRVAPLRMEERILRLTLSLLLLGGLACTTIQTMLPQDNTPHPTDLPGGELPLRATCTVLATTAGQQIPIQFRDQLRQSVELVAYQECMQVLVVMVSVAMVDGDDTQDGVDIVRARLAGAESQYLADTCDEHFRAFRFLLNPERGYENALDGAGASGQYDEWMDRCYRVVRPLSAAPTPQRPVVEPG